MTGRSHLPLPNRETITWEKEMPLKQLDIARKEILGDLHSSWIPLSLPSAIPALTFRVFYGKPTPTSPIP